uniref:Uncharacterized protein n=1 Tax=Avena sativa TaxID=4498 RepID=A0ACD5ZDX5_AVESA
MEEQAKLLADLTASISSMNAKLDDIHPAVLDLHTWKPEMEKSVSALRAEVGDLRARVIDLTRDKISATSPRGAMPPLLPTSVDAPSSSHKPSSLVLEAANHGGDDHGQSGRRDASDLRGDHLGDFPPPGVAPVKGTYYLPCPGYDSSEFVRGSGSHHFPPPPRVDFPLFDGDNPRAWQLKCEAYFQEGVLESYRQEARRAEFSPMPRPIPCTAMPLPTPSLPRNSTLHGQRGEDRKGGEETRPPPAEDKLAALRNYRRARGLCFTCGERWSREHRCGLTVQLHVVEELLAMVQPEEAPEQPQERAGSDTASQFMHISQAAADGGQAASTMRLQGWIQQQEVLMLIDSGSSHTFVSSAVAEKLQAQTRAIAPLQVKVANGGLMHCGSELINCEWWTQGYQFKTDFKILPLGSYDVILGYDWLTQHSPMEVDWKAQRMSFHYKNQTVNLVGVQPDMTKCAQVSHEQLQFLLQHSRVSRVVQLCLLQPEKNSGECELPDEAAPLLEEYQVLFEEPTELPPPRQFDHAIPLLPGAKPVNLRPYRYNPAQKDEVERQIKQMLEQGIIRFSTSPYSSPVILVLKKDLTWRFCVDFRQLNAITVKNRYPLPVIDELLDELAGAYLFTSLDLRAGYHQIRMRPEDEHKTAFKTHNGHFEFRVMAYGLTGAPATFQGLMNTILHPLLRKGVLVFIDDILVYSKDLASHLSLLRLSVRYSCYAPAQAQGELAAISICLPSWLTEVQQGYISDPLTQKLLTQRAANPPEGPTEFQLEDGILKLRGRVWVGRNEGLQQRILGALHSSAVGGHSGFGVTYRRVRTLFAWPGLKEQVRQFVDSCAICKQAKPERVRYPGLLEPLPVPPHLWHTVTMDFVEGLPHSVGYNCILVMVDKLSRYSNGSGARRTSFSCPSTASSIPSSTSRSSDVPYHQQKPSSRSYRRQPPLYRSPFACWRRACTSKAGTPRRRSGSSGRNSRRRWQPGKISMSFSIASRRPQLGDKLALNRGRVSRATLLPRQWATTTGRPLQQARREELTVHLCGGASEPGGPTSGTCKSVDEHPTVDEGST